MFVSILVTCYNLESYIGSALESVFCQDYTGNFEVIVVDDCSTDGSIEVINRFPNVKLISNEVNQGVLLSTIKGLKAATGELVFFLDGDDVWSKEKVTESVARFQARPNLAFFTHELKIIDSKGNETLKKPISVDLNLEQPNLCSEQVRNGLLCHCNYLWLGSAYVIRRSIINLDDFFAFLNEQPNLRECYQDWPLAFWIACQPDISFAYSPKIMMSYRIHGLNHSGDSSSADRAIRNVARQRNTVLLMFKMLKYFGGDRMAWKAASQKLRFSEYLHDLYTGRRLKSCCGFFSSIPFLISRKSLLKETIRLLVCQCFGLTCFVRILSFLRRSFSHRLRSQA